MKGVVLHGIITDGDIQRAFDKVENPMHLLTTDVMTDSPMTIEMNERF